VIACPMHAVNATQWSFSQYFATIRSSCSRDKLVVPNYGPHPRRLDVDVYVSSLLMTTSSMFAHRPFLAQTHFNWNPRLGLVARYLCRDNATSGFSLACDVIQLCHLRHDLFLLLGWRLCAGHPSLWANSPVLGQSLQASHNYEHFRANSGKF